MKKRTKRDYFVSAIVAAGGRGSRMGADINKIFLELCALPVIAYSLITLEKSNFVDEIIIVAAENDIPGCGDIVKEFKISKVKSIVKGGKTRRESVKNGIGAVSEKSGIIIIHDAARPLVAEETVEKVVCGAHEYGCAAPGAAEKNTLKLVKDGFIERTVDRENIYMIHTPQGFRADIAKSMHEKAEAEGIEATDDCFLAESMGEKILLVPDSYENIKITTKDDLAVAENIIQNSEFRMQK